MVKQKTFYYLEAFGGFISKENKILTIIYLAKLIFQIKTFSFNLKTIFKFIKKNSSCLVNYVSTVVLVLRKSLILNPKKLKEELIVLVF